MSLLTRAGDLVYAFRFINLLITPFEKTEAYKLGIIDDNGKRDKTVDVDTPEKKSAYTVFHKLVFNLKRLIAKVPGGSSRLGTYAAALYLIKEKYNFSDRTLAKINEKLGVDQLDFLAENTQWFVLPDKMLSPGTYRLKYDKIISETADELAYANNQVVIQPNAFPVGQIFGLDIYEATHVNTNKKVHITVSELLK
jgi:hypothetical protein